MNRQPGGLLARVAMCMGLMAGLSMPQSPGQSATAQPFAPFNVRVGSQTFAPKYEFDLNTTRLVETAQRLHEMGSDIAKFAMSSGSAAGYRLPPFGDLDTLTKLARDEPSYHAVFDMPFSCYLIWAYPLAVSGSEHHNWRDGLSSLESSREYKEIYDFARYLLRTYSGSGKTFLLGHWEGDWALLGSTDAGATPSPTAIQGMIDWLAVRQQAVDAARGDEPHDNVFVGHYSEVNLVDKAMSGGTTVTNDVLPHVVLDGVSYSSYDTIFGPTSRFLAALDHIAAKANLSGRLAQGVFVGEYGFPLDFGARTPEQQAAESTRIVKAATGWGCPFVLYWQMYDNEAEQGGENARGFWLIDNHNRPQPVYDVHRRFCGKAHAFKNVHRFWLGRNPTEAEFSAFAGNFDGTTILARVERTLNTTEYHGCVSSASFVALLGEALFGSADAGDPEGYLPRLAAGERRSAILYELLDSPRFAAACGDAEFTVRLHAGMLLRHVSASSPAVRETLNRLANGVSRSMLWREMLDDTAFFEAELSVRHENVREAPFLQGKYLFDRRSDLPSDVPLMLR